MKKISLVKEALEDFEKEDPEMKKLSEEAKKYLKEHPEREFYCAHSRNGDHIIIGRTE